MQKRAIAILLLAGCVPLQRGYVGREAELVLYPKLYDRMTQAVVPANTVSSIATLDIVPYMFDGAAYKPISSVTGLPLASETTETLKLSQSSPSVDPNRPFILRHLKPNTPYRIFARAWNQQNQMISVEASSSVDINVGSDDAPSVLNLPVWLSAIPFSASTQVQINLDRTGRCAFIRTTLLQGGTQLRIAQTIAPNPTVYFNNLEGNSTYQLLVEACQSGGSVLASSSTNLVITNDTIPATQSIALTIPWVASTVAGLAGSPGTADGVGTAARFQNPLGAAVDSAGNIYVSDRFNYTVRKIAPGGVVSTFAGFPGSIGALDGTGTAARLANLVGVTVGSGGTLYIADYDNQAVRKITSSAVVTTFAGLLGSSGTTDGAGTLARFYRPCGITLDGSGNLFLTDQFNHTIRKVSAAGDVTTIAGNPGTPGSVDGTGPAARFCYPSGVAVDAAGTLYISDQQSHAIRKITSGGVVTTFAGQLLGSGTADGVGTAARFNFPCGVAIDNAGNLYVTDRANNTIRKITSSGVVTTLVGLPGATGSVDGTGTAARLNGPYGIGIDGNGALFVTEDGNHTIRMVW